MDDGACVVDGSGFDGLGLKEVVSCENIDKIKLNVYGFEKI
jgi:hypothetical protein